MEIGEIPSEQKPTPRPPEIKVREKLSDEELGNLISAVGNHEAKAITLGLMLPGNTYSAYQLYKGIIGLQGEDMGWNISDRVPFGYCQSTLYPIGLVAQELIDPDLKTVGFMKTSRGRNEGDALAGLTLDFSLRYPEFSLQDFFGNTASSSKLQETN